MEIKSGVLGIYGSSIERILRRVPIENGAAAITLGHVILARNQSTFYNTFDHELVHVRQYQWFGPIFIPAYLMESLWQWGNNKDPYLDNRFEIQARHYS